jgi:hypothetical protein
MRKTARLSYELMKSVRTGRGSLTAIKRAQLMRRLPELRPVTRLAEIFRAQQGDVDAQKIVSIGEASEYEPARTFEGFLQVNRLPVYEEVLR